MKTQTAVLVLLGLITIQVGFGGYSIVLTKFAKDSGVDSLVFSILRDACCCPLLFFAAFVFERGFPPPKAADLPLFFLLGLFGMFVNQYMFIEGLYFTTSNISSIFQPSIPVFTALFAFITGMEHLPTFSVGYRYQWLKVLGILLGTGGAVLMLVAKDTHESTHDEMKNKTVGVIFLLGNCAGMAIYVLLQRRFIFQKHKWAPELTRWKKYPVAVTAYSYFFGALCMCICAAIRLAITKDTSVFHIPKKCLSALIYAVFVSSALCYGLITVCGKYVSPTIVTAFWPLQVLVVFVLSKFVLGEELVRDEYFGMALIIGGMFAVIGSKFFEGDMDDEDDDDNGSLNDEKRSLLINKEYA